VVINPGEKQLPFGAIENLQMSRATDLSLLHLGTISLGLVARFNAAAISGSMD
jgi:hypothetical protein